MIPAVIATAVGPWILGRATDLIFAGLIGRDVLATGATQEQAIEELRARGEDNQADMLASMDLTDGVDFSAVADVLPYVGALLACGPAVLASVPRGPGVVLAVLIALSVYQEFESRFIVPRVYGRVLRLPSSVVIIALLVGGKLLGVLGALLSLPVAAGIIGHMNADHGEAQVLYCRHFAGRPDTVAATMSGVDRYGFEMVAEGPGGRAAVRLGFPEPCTTADEVRRAMVAMVGEARRRASPP